MVIVTAFLEFPTGKSYRLAGIRQWGWVWSLSELTNSSQHFGMDMTQTLLCPEHLFFLSLIFKPCVHFMGNFTRLFLIHFQLKAQNAGFVRAL